MMLLVRALRGLRRHPLRTGLSLLGVAVSTALLLDMVMLGGGLERSFEQLLLGRGFQIRLSPRGTLPFDTEATLAGERALVSLLRADPEVAEAGAVLGLAVRTSHGDSLVSLVGYGLDPEGQGLYRLREGSALAPHDSTGLVIGQSVARALGWRLGDTVQLVGRLDPQAMEAGRRRAVVVRGVVDWLYDTRGQRSVGMTLPVARMLAGMRDDRASVILVRVVQDSAVPRIAERLTADLPRVEVHSIASLVARFRARVTYFRQLAIILGTISLVVAGLLIGTLMMITVNERLAEIATLRVLGVSRHRVVTQVMLEGLVLTVLGGTIGVVLGLVTARQLDLILTAFPGLPAGISFFVARPEHLMRAVLVLLAVGVVAGAWPAWLASRAPLAAALREEGT
jgi:putative ABC transport system permease protein